LLIFKDVRILQDFCEFKAGQIVKKLRLSNNTGEESLNVLEFKERMLTQVNKNLEEDKFGLLESFFKKNSQSLVNLFNKFL
jgi:hypothetical protein